MQQFGGQPPAHPGAQPQMQHAQMQQAQMQQGGYPQAGPPSGPQPQAGAMMAPQPGAMQPMMGNAVCGEPLQQGERVVYYRTMDYSTSKTIYLVMGILFMPLFFIGAIFLWLRSKIDRDNPKAIAVTTQRVLVQQGNGMTVTHWLQNVSDLEPVRQRAHGHGGGLVGALVAAGASAVMDSMANKKAKTDPKYWSRAIGIIFIDHQGNKAQVSCQEKPKEMIDLGMFIAQGIVQGGFNSYPDVQFA
jgi:hypothetical protein